MRYKIEFELPDNDTVLKEIKHASVGWQIWGYSGIAKPVPSIDAVPVIRCKDCKHKTDCFSEVAMTNEYQTTTLYEPIEWCSKAERKES